jgi:hypothetical protein
LVETNDVIELGQARYRLDWNVVINNLNVNDNLNATSGYPPSNNRPAPRPNYNRPSSPANNNPTPPFSSNQQNNTWLFVGIGAFVFIAIIIVGVFISQNSRSGLYDDISVSSYSSDDSYSDSYDDEVKVDEPSAPVEEEKPQMVTCPGCNGTGVFDFAPGDIMAPKQTCAGCNGTGVCSAETAKELIKVQQLVNGTMGGGAGGYSSGGTSDGSTVTCGMCNGSGYYHWPGAPRYSGNSDPQWTNCMNCGQVIDACSSHSCRCQKCNGTGQV